MSFLTTTPELLTSAVADLQNIGSALNEAHAAAAEATTGLAVAGADEVSSAVAALFARYGQQYQTLAGDVAAFHDQFAASLVVGANSYATAEATNLGQLLSNAAATPLNLINTPVEDLTGRPLIGNGANGSPNAQGAGPAGGAGGWLYGNGGTGGTSTAAGIAGGAGGAAGLIGNGGAGSASTYAGATGGAGGAAVLIGNGGAGGASGPGGVGGTGGRAGLLWGTAGAAGVNTALPSNETLLSVDQYGNPIISISVGGGSTVSAIVDTGSTGLLIPETDVKLSSLGTATGSGSVTYGSSSDYEVVQYQTYQTTVNLGNGIVTGTTTVDVATSAIQYYGGRIYNVSLSSITPILGIGPNDGYPSSTPVTAALSGNLSEGELIDEAAGVLEFGPNPLTPVVSVSGSPQATLEVQIDGGSVQTVSGAYIDSGGLTGAIPSTLISDVSVGDTVPVGTTITVYSSGGTELYSETVTSSATAPDVVSSSDVFNTGNYLFSIDPVYISNSPSGEGMTIIDA